MVIQHCYVLVPIGGCMFYLGWHNLCWLHSVVLQSNTHSARTEKLVWCFLPHLAVYSFCQVELPLSLIWHNSSRAIPDLQSHIEYQSSPKHNHNVAQHFQPTDCSRHRTPSVIDMHALVRVRPAPLPQYLHHASWRRIRKSNPRVFHTILRRRSSTRFGAAGYNLSLRRGELRLPLRNSGTLLVLRWLLVISPLRPWCCLISKGFKWRMDFVTDPNTCCHVGITFALILLIWRRGCVLRLLWDWMWLVRGRIASGGVKL